MTRSASPDDTVVRGSGDRAGLSATPAAPAISVRCAGDPLDRRRGDLFRGRPSWSFRPAPSSRAWPRRSSWAISSTGFRRESAWWSCSRRRRSSRTTIRRALPASTSSSPYSAPSPGRWGSHYDRERKRRAAEARAARAERERETLARVAVAEERTRIARELHDIVAHSMSVMVLQVGAVRHGLPDELSDAKEALEDVEQAGPDRADGDASASRCHAARVGRCRARASARPRGAGVAARRRAQDGAARRPRGRRRGGRAPAGARSLRVSDRAGGAHERPQARRRDACRGHDHVPAG